MEKEVGSTSAIGDLLVLEAQSCRDWVKQADGRAFEVFYTKVLESLVEIGVIASSSTPFYEVPLQKRLEDLERLEKHHRLELEAAFIAAWLSKDMKPYREAYYRKHGNR